MPVILAGLFLVWAAPAQAQCPEDLDDPGICDTLYVEVYPSDSLFTGFARVLIYITHDVPVPDEDSLTDFQIPLCYTHSNAANYCSLSYHWNNFFVYPYPPQVLERSVFRHIIEDGDTLIHNWRMDQAETGLGLEWNFLIYDLDGTSHFWLFTGKCGPPDQLFGEGSRVLVATLTFKMEDTMTVCLDTCFWPPANRLTFVKEEMSITFIPRHNLPHCFSLSYPQLGDANADGTIDIGDVVYLINYLYRASPSPVPTPVGDTNCDGVVDIGDVVRLIGYLYRGEPPPSC